MFGEELRRLSLGLDVRLLGLDRWWEGGSWLELLAWRWRWEERRLERLRLWCPVIRMEIGT